MKKNKIDVIWGSAKLNGKGKVVRSRRPRTRRRGRSAPASIPRSTSSWRPARARACCRAWSPTKKLVWTYFEAMVPDVMPKSLLVVGSGAIGIEFASFFRTLGAEVTVVEVLPQILPVEDDEIAAHARKRFEKQGMKIHTDAKVTKLDKGKDGVTATIELKGGKTETLKVDRVISAVGVVGNIEGLGLEDARREDRPRRHRRRRPRPHERRRHLRDRRRRRPADARPQGRARGRRLRRGDQGAEAARHGQAEDSRLHLLQPADRLRRPDREQGQGGRLSS